MDHLRISKGNADLKSILMTGQYADTAGWVANTVEGDVVTFFQPNGDLPSKGFRWFKAVRPISLTATFMPALTTVLLCLFLGAAINFWVLIPALIAMLCLQMSVNMLNDVEDYLKLIDLPDSLGGSGVIQQAWLSTQQIRLGAWVCFILAVLFALPAFIYAPSIILLCALMAGIGVIGYSSGPFGFKYYALGDVLVFLLCGPVLTLGVSLAATGDIVENTFWLGLYFGFLATTILNANNINDITVDMKSGSKTFASIVGFKQASVFQLLLYVCAGSVLIVLVVKIGLFILLPMLALPLVIRHLFILFKSKRSDDSSLNEVRFDAAKLHLLMSLLLCIALLIMWMMQ